MAAVRLSTNRLVLRRVHESDRGAILAYATLPDASVREAFDGLPAVADLRRQTNLKRPGDTLTLAVESMLEARLIGLVRVNWERGDPRLGTMQFVFDPTFAHRGYCIEALQAVVDFIFSNLPIDRLTTECVGAQKTTAVVRGMTRLGVTAAPDGKRYLIARDRWQRALAA